MSARDLPTIIPPTTSTLKNKFQENITKSRSGTVEPIVSSGRQAASVGKLSINPFESKAAKIAPNNSTSR